MWRWPQSVAAPTTSALVLVVDGLYDRLAREALEVADHIGEFVLQRAQDGVYVVGHDHLSMCFIPPCGAPSALCDPSNSESCRGRRRGRCGA